MSLVMGLDQHRAQISAGWVDTVTGEVCRARIIPADRAGVQKFLKRFDGDGLEVALEATTGWRFVIEELERVGAEVHLAEPTETSGLKSKKKRAKTDWADARHLRELLLIGRVPEPWIPPAHILDLRGRVRLRHTLSHQRTEWQQRIQAVLYHHGFPRRRDLLSLQKREWLDRLKLPAAARQQVTIALEMIDALDIQLTPFDVDLRAYARKQPGCRALNDQIYGIGELTSVTILAEVGDGRRFPSPRDVVRYSGLDITVYQSDQHRAPGHLSRPGPPALRWALYEAAQRARFPEAPTAPTTSRPRSGSAATEHASPWRASCSSVATTSSKPSGMTRSSPSPPKSTSFRDAPDQPMNRGQLPPIAPTRTGQA